MTCWNKNSKSFTITNSGTTSKWRWKTILHFTGYRVDCQKFNLSQHLCNESDNFYRQSNIQYDHNDIEVLNVAVKRKLTQISILRITNKTVWSIHCILWAGIFCCNETKLQTRRTLSILIYLMFGVAFLNFKQQSKRRRIWGTNTFLLGESSGEMVCEVLVKMHK